MKYESRDCSDHDKVERGGLAGCDGKEEAQGGEGFGQLQACAAQGGEGFGSTPRPAHPLPVLPKSSDSLGSAARGGHLLGLADLRHRRVMRCPRWSGKNIRVHKELNLELKVGISSRKAPLGLFQRNRTRQGQICEQ